MAAALMLGVGTKAAGDRVRITCDWGNEPLLIAGNAITAYTVTCPGVGAPTVSGTQLNSTYQTSALFTGGSVGTYSPVFAITLNNADSSILSRTGALEIV